MAASNTDQFVFVMYIVSITIGNSLSEEISEKGVCKKTEVVTKLRYYTYNKWVDENYRDPDCLIFKCTLKRRVQRTFHKYSTLSEPQQSLECCPGYKQLNRFYYEELKCAPMCSNNCENGVCTGPEECTCDLGYHIDPNNRYICIPLCKKGCGKHENCVAPDKCKCEEGYTKVYNDECQPDCDDACPANSVCVAPNKCECFEGFKQSNKSYDCDPICSSGCSNGRCVSPEECICDKGYAMYYSNDNKNGTCQPICRTPCNNGSCVAPNTCECSPGYKMSENNTCVPDCSNGCVNGKCVGPETCKCLEGYAKNEYDVCKPVCNNKCVNGYCVSPDKCACGSGWVLKASSTGNDKICEPICTNPCVNGTCIAPEVCSCLKGYIKIKEIRENITYEICQPQCSKGCYNGTCVSPENCMCNEGWSLNKTYQTETNVCKPICKKICAYGTCVAPDTCECLPGYKKSKNPSADNICEAHCTNGCPHGTCISPENCVCDEGWHLIIVNQTKFFRCSPKCQKGCLHGICTSENSCECVPVESFVCGPYCSNGCPNGQCIAPETCACDKGFAMTEGTSTKDLICQPVCTNPCINGKCVAPDECECFEGYEKITKYVINITSNTNDCVNGTCTASKSWSKYNHICEPVCNGTCINSICEAPNTCKCLQGYKRCSNVSTDNICELNCPTDDTLKTDITHIITIANAIIETSTIENLHESTNVTRAEMFINMQWFNYVWFYTVSGAFVGSLLTFLLVMVRIWSKKYYISEEETPTEFGLDFVTQPRWTFVRS